jgi:hypothetical protein
MLLFAGGRSSLAAQAEQAGGAEKAAVIREILDVTHATEQVVTMIEAGVALQRNANPRVPAVFWDRFLAQARRRQGEFIDSLVPVYARAFDVADLKAMLELYKSPFGQRLLAAQPKVAQESMALGQRWGALIGAQVGQQLAAEGVQMQF